MPDARNRSSGLGTSSLDIPPPAVTYILTTTPHHEAHITALSPLLPATRLRPPALNGRTHPRRLPQRNLSFPLEAEHTTHKALRAALPLAPALFTRTTPQRDLQQRGPHALPQYSTNQSALLSTSTLFRVPPIPRLATRHHNSPPIKTHLRAPGLKERRCTAVLGIAVRRRHHSRRVRAFPSNSVVWSWKRSVFQDPGSVSGEAV